MCKPAYVCCVMECQKKRETLSRTCNLFTLDQKVQLHVVSDPILLAKYEAIATIGVEFFLAVLEDSFTWWVAIFHVKSQNTL